MSEALQRIRRRLNRAKQRRETKDAQNPTLTAIAHDPSMTMALAGMPPDDWQQQLLRSSAKRMLLLASRQSGKSQSSAAYALHIALTQPGALVLLLSPTERQSGELFRDKVMRLYRDLGKPVAKAQETALQLSLTNGSRIVSLPGQEGTIRGYSGVKLLLIDEAARVSDDLYRSVRPMLAVSNGTMIALSSAWAKQGWFYEEWQGDGPWSRIKITANDCPRITPEFLKEEREALGDRWYRMEYLCEFADTVAGLFTGEDIEAACDDTLEPLFPLRKR